MEPLRVNEEQNASEECDDYVRAGTFSTAGYRTVFIKPRLSPSSVSVLCYFFEYARTCATIVLSRYSNGGFNRSWVEYKYGFGTGVRSYWLGNENLYMIVNSNPEKHFMLKIDVIIEDKLLQSFCEHFRVANESNKYKASFKASWVLSQINTTDRDLDFNGSYFSTFDEDNDNSDEQNCASLIGGGWWYNNKCSKTRPTGESFTWLNYTDLLINYIIMILIQID
ncbi:angiopoietin-1-like [Tubulanus polymorphus]|uniref:angiopoietin-1-like n=1 Tax=Tubulanus polymorphus TaxID=672921 RepID=UPI003DA34B4B